MEKEWREKWGRMEKNNQGRMDEKWNKNEENMEEERN